jgi:Uma2 family endonuclease
MVAVTAVLQNRQVDIPAWVVDLESFCRWEEGDDYPESGRICYLKDRVWVDMSMEEMNHNQLKGEFAVVVGNLVRIQKLGRYFHDRMRLTNTAASLAAEPDGMFASAASFNAGRVQLAGGRGESPLRVEGTPDMVLEVVSRASVQKDTVDLRQLYWDAGIPEYWLVDPLGKRLTFDILRHTARGYVVSRKQGGWRRSAVFGKAFRLTQQTGADGFPEYTLAGR